MLCIRVILSCVNSLEVGQVIWDSAHGPLARYVKLGVAHAPGMPGPFSLPARVRDPDMHHGTCVTHVPWCMPRSLTGGFHWSRWRGKRSRHSRCVRNPQFYVSGKRTVPHEIKQGDIVLSVHMYVYICICMCIYARHHLSNINRMEWTWDSMMYV